VPEVSNMERRTLVLLGFLVAVACPVSAQVVPDPATREHETILSGFVGSSFEEEEDGSVDFGGSVSWLWEGRVGTEFLVGFAPHFSAGGEDNTQVESYMANVIAAVPLDTDGRWQPFVSGGFGALGIRHEDDEFDIDAPDASDWGANIGGGVMGFADRWGFRGDIRYLRQVGENPGEGVVDSFLENLDFMRVSVGMAFRW
jgi:hypothetical protein